MEISQTEQTARTVTASLLGRMRKPIVRIRRIHPWLYQSRPALNGQRFRQEMFRSLLQELQPDAVFESGTYRGATTQFLWHVSGRPVYTVEKDPALARLATRRFRDVTEIRVMKSDSRKALQSLRENSSFPKSRIFFYLDAHWEEDLPLREEVAIITEGWTDSLILIDDFKVPDDPGYGFDTYAGTQLSIEYLGDAVGAYQVFWPNCPSSEETGARRGCVLLAAPTLADRMAALDPVRSMGDAVPLGRAGSR
ncbi:hypothetical protein ACIP4U_08165 [Streptomyces caelestis]|jgi:hypothetical protein|uniref:Methyltransferase n=1 Tax=Streptomyces caelestis TaxID=36816 RepID=A0A7W9H554_9ACTN|nr:hypothetical protein [Streptomyces caelestis]MBB5795593.1 hypothetical protein [Streptomyces caelestis]GGW61029.1 hypothetical protein GCM10010320_47690 [Streptomyces caelestis]